MTGILKGYDPLLNLVLDETKEWLRDPFDPYKITGRVTAPLTSHSLLHLPLDPVLPASLPRVCPLFPSPCVQTARARWV